MPIDINTKDKFYSRNCLEIISKQKYRILNSLENTSYGENDNDYICCIDDELTSQYYYE